jgi:hypothetical protein
VQMICCHTILPRRNESAAAVLATQGWRPLNCATDRPSQGPRFQPLPSPRAIPPRHCTSPCPSCPPVVCMLVCVPPSRPVPSPFLSTAVQPRQPRPDSASTVIPPHPARFAQGNAALERTYHLVARSSLDSLPRTDKHAVCFEKQRALKETTRRREPKADLVVPDGTRFKNTFLIMLQQKLHCFVFKSPQLLCQN